ncbi:hypothetical protein VUR80DRAFT_5225 [Thermomyces stellatus]
MVGIEQRTHDVDFDINIPFETPPCDPPSPRRLLCKVVYNPGDDNCVRVNQSNIDIRLIGPDPPENRYTLRYKGTHVVGPGIWRISVEGHEPSSEQHLIDLLVLHRRFSVSVHEALPAPSGSMKRPSVNEDEAATSRGHDRSAHCPSSPCCP